MRFVLVKWERQKRKTEICKGKITKRVEIKGKLGSQGEVKRGRWI